MFPSASKLNQWNPSYVASKLDSNAENKQQQKALGLERVLQTSDPAREVVYVNLERIERDPALQERMRSWGFPQSYFAHIQTQKRVAQMSANEFFSSNQSSYWSQGGVCSSLPPFF